MSIQNFCLNCPHRKIPKTIKEKFNEYVEPKFFECPIYDENVVGCLIKYTKIEWKAMTNWLIDNNLLDKEEEKVLIGLGIIKKEEKDA